MFETLPVEELVVLMTGAHQGSRPILRGGFYSWKETVGLVSGPGGSACSGLTGISLCLLGVGVGGGKVWFCGTLRDPEASVGRPWRAPRRTGGGAAQWVKPSSLLPGSRIQFSVFCRITGSDRPPGVPPQPFVLPAVLNSELLPAGILICRCKNPPAGLSVRFLCSSAPVAGFMFGFSLKTSFSFNLLPACLWGGVRIGWGGFCQPVLLLDNTISFITENTYLGSKMLNFFV